MRDTRAKLVWRGGPKPVIGLTPRQREVFEHIRAGRKVTEIAALLGIGFHSVYWHAQRAAWKLCDDYDVGDWGSIRRLRNVA